MNRVLLVSILVVAVMLASITLSASKPDWVAPGKYAEYEVVVKTNETELRGVLRWEVKEVHDTYAMVEVTGLMHVSFVAWFETTTRILVAMEGRAGY